nr:hypothetical protein [Acidithiobacillus ferriphilus]
MDLRILFTAAGMAIDAGDQVGEFAFLAGVATAGDRKMLSICRNACATAASWAAAMASRRSRSATAQTIDTLLGVEKVRS